MTQVAGIVLTKESCAKMTFLNRAFIRKSQSGLLKNSNRRRLLALQSPGKTRIVVLQIGLFQQAPIVFQESHEPTEFGFGQIWTTCLSLPTARPI